MSERTILVTVCAAMALALLAVFSPLVLIAVLVLAGAPFVYLWADWRLTRRRKFYD